MKKWIYLLLVSLCLFPFSGKVEAKSLSTAEKLLCVNQEGWWWVDGVQQFQAIEDHRGLWMRGMTLHEGGIGFALKATSNSKKWTLGPTDVDGWGFCPEGYVNLEYKELGMYGEPYLIIRDRANVLVNILRGGEDLKEAAVSGICLWLKGTYVDENDNQIVFESYPQTVQGFPGVTHYTVESVFDIPAKIITLSPGRSYSVETEEVSSSGAPRLRLERVKPTEGDYWEPTGEETLFLTKILWWEDEEEFGRYPFTDSVVLPGWFMLYTVDELGFIRNEIYARHGYIFQNSKYKTYFEAQPWYRPVSRNVDGKLSPEERLNVEMITEIEEWKRLEL